MNMTKFFLVALLFLFIAIFSFTNVLAQQPTTTDSSSEAISVNSYELFWPITAGKTMGDSIYWLKSLKESFREMLIFGDLRKASYNLELSTKRVVEAEKLYLNDKDDTNGKKTLDAAQSKREKILKIISDLKSKNLGSRAIESNIAETFQRQKTLLQHIASNVSQDQKKDIETYILKIDELISKLQES